MRFFKVLSLSHKDEGYKLIIQFLKFGIVGFSNTFIFLAIYYILIYTGINYIAANTIAFMISVLNAYYWNSKYVFKKAGEYNINLVIKTFISYGATFILSTVLLFIMINWLDVSKIIAPVINLLITVPLNFLLNKFWAFK